MSDIGIIGWSIDLIIIPGQGQELVILCNIDIIENAIKKSYTFLSIRFRSLFSRMFTLKDNLNNNK